MKLSLKILIHSIFWFVFMGATIGSSYNKFAIDYNLNSSPHLIINLFWALAIFYPFYFYFIQFFERGKFVRYFLLAVAASCVATIIFMPLHAIFASDFNVLDYRIFGPPMAGTFILAQCGSLVRGFENWFENIKLKTELENRNLKNELELLKSQVNPHFLFNTLNNIDTLIFKSPDDASKSLLTLSDMLRYMIYETNEEYISLNKEIEHLKSYISLQKLRFKTPNYIQSDFPSNCTNIHIAPMLFLPFVENAFKYVSTKAEHPAINVAIQCSKNQLNFKCTNYYTPTTNNKSHTGGVGLENVKRRLELIYNKKHTLCISKKKHIFNVELNIDLS